MAVRKSDEYAAIGLVSGKMHALSHLINQPAGSFSGVDRLIKAETLVDDITDALLSAPEPHRTEWMTLFVPFREAIRNFKMD